MLALLAIVSAIVGVASVAILHQSLVTRIDQQLASAVGRGQGGFDDHDDRNGLGPNGGSNAAIGLRVPGQAVGTVGAVVLNNSVVSAAVITEQGAVSALTSEQATVLASVASASSFVTIELPGLGNYRAASGIGPSGTTFVVAVPLAEAQATSAQLAIIIAVVALIALGVAALAGRFFIRRSLAPLELVTDTATRVSELPLDRGDVDLNSEHVPDADERTEVGKLAAAFNRMLGHVSRSLDAREQSEQKVRQFVADASHELRTPLASIRGYAELTRMSGEKLPKDASHALGRIEAESVRMTALVEDLLLLARLDEGRELELREVDLTPMLADIVADARVTGTTHSFTLVEPEFAVLVQADESRLRQVFVNLLANARVHTPEGTEVSVSLDLVGDHARVVVHDNGPGIDPAVADTLFERFARADSSRSRVAGSTGLGLAIASAVVHAHHGELTVESEPGSTSFVVSLPLAPSVG